MALTEAGQNYLAIIRRAFELTSDRTHDDAYGSQPGNAPANGGFGHSDRLAL
jgi:hypothetical protein